MRRIVVVGTSGSGKSYLASRLATALGLPFIDLDDLFWKPGWEARSKEEFSALVAKAASGRAWVIAGNQTKIRELIWPRADLVIWLDLPLYLLLFRALKRGLQQIWSGEEICGGNRESLSRLFGPKSILIWIMKTYFRRRRIYLPLFTEEKMVRLTSSKEIPALISRLTALAQ